MRKLRSSEIITLMEIRNSSCQSYSWCGSSDFWDSTGNHPALLKKNHHCPFIYSHAGTICSYTLYCRATLQRYFSFLWPGSPLEGGGPPKRQCTSQDLAILTGFQTADFFPGQCTQSQKQPNSFRKCSFTVFSLCWLWQQLFFLQLHTLHRI